MGYLLEKLYTMPLESGRWYRVAYPLSPHYIIDAHYHFQIRKIGPFSWIPIDERGFVTYNLTSKIRRCSMVILGTTRMSSKGQVVIPEEVREKLGFCPGTQFEVLGSRGTIVLRPLSVPSQEEFDRIVAESEDESE
jgi:AbrB family looped-hinge helix DNA binding protein